MENILAEVKCCRNTSYINQHTKAELASGTDPSTRQRGTLVEAPIILQNEVQKRAGYWNSHHIFCTSDVLGKETTILPGGCEAKHNTHVLAVHTGTVPFLLLACSLPTDSAFRTKH